MTKNKPLLFLIAVIGLLAVLVLWAIASIGLYHLMIRIMPSSWSPTILWSLWTAYEFDPVQLGKLKQAMGLSAMATVMGVALLLNAIFSNKRELHGSARFATNSEVEKAGLSAERGIILGKWRNKYLVFSGQEFVLLAAPTRSGKGVGVVIPNCLNWHDSLVVLDIKGENYDLTSGFRATHGQEVYVFNPFDREFKTHRWNPLAEISRDQNFIAAEVLNLAVSFYPTEGVKDPFFNEQAQNLFMGLVMYLIETESRYPDRPVSIGEVLRQASGYGAPLAEHLAGIIAADRELLSGTCVNALNRFMSAPENTFGSIKGSLEAPLTIFTNRITDAATSASDFRFKDLRRKRMTIYLVIPPGALQLTGTSRLVNLFFSQLLTQNLDELPQKDDSLKYSVLLLLDEFTSIGKIPVLAKGVSFIAGYNIRLLPIVQSISQLESVYGKEDARTFTTNHAVTILFTPKENSDAKEASEILGTYTEKSVSNSRNNPGMFKGGPSTGTSTSDQRRALMMPQELREMPQTECIILKQGTKPIKAEKIFYYQDPLFTARLLPASHVPTMNMAAFGAVLDGKQKEQGERDVQEQDLEAIQTQAITLMPDDMIPQYEEGMDVEMIFAAYANGVKASATY